MVNLSWFETKHLKKKVNPTFSLIQEVKDSNLFVLLAASLVLLMVSVNSVALLSGRTEITTKGIYNLFIFFIMECENISVLKLRYGYFRKQRISVANESLGVG